MENIIEKNGKCLLPMYKFITKVQGISVYDVYVLQVYVYVLQEVL